MDEHNVHHFWGISPALDLGSLLPTSGDDAAAVLPVDQPVRMLQVAPYDARHTLTTICRVARHPALLQQKQPVQLVVWEDSAEGLARHLVLLAVMLDGCLLPRERTEMVLELHGNAVLRERAAAYLDEKARQLESLVVELSGGGGPSRGAAGAAGSGAEAEAPDGDPRGLAALVRMLDLSLLKFQEKDQLVEALQKWRLTVVYDMVKAWDARARKWYGDRYDFRRNLVDWDYHMRLQAAGTPGQDPAHGSIIHFHHFRHWRMHGVAHELRDSHYNQPNRSLLSTAYGRTREFKDRSLRDVGRSVSAWGFWADVLNGPYHCFGTLTEEPSFYKITNKQYSRTAVDVAEHNLTVLLHELRTGQRLTLAAGSEAPRAKVARGPTSLEDLQHDAAQQQQQPGEQGEQGEAAPSGTVPGSGAAKSAAGAAGAEALPGPSAGSGGSSGEAGGSGSATSQPPPPPPPSPPPPPAPSPPPPQSEPEDQPQAEHQQQQQQAALEGLGPDEIPRYTTGGMAAVANAMAAAANTGPTSAPAIAVAATEGSGAGADSAAGGAAPANEAQSSVAGGGGDGGGSDAAATATAQMAAEEAALRAAEAALDAAGRARASSLFRLQLVTGDLAKGVTGRAKYGNAFSVLSVGHRHIHMLAPEHGLFKAAAPGAVLVAENARHLLQLNKEQAGMFVAKMDEMAAAAGWIKQAARPQGVTEASEVYVKPRAQ